MPSLCLGMIIPRPSENGLSECVKSSSVEFTYVRGRQSDCCFFIGTVDTRVSGMIHKYRLSYRTAALCVTRRIAIGLYCAVANVSIRPMRYPRSLEQFLQLRCVQIDAGKAIAIVNLIKYE